MCHVAHMANTLLHPFSQSRQWWINMNKLDLAHTKKGSAQSHAIFLPMKGPIYFSIKPYCWWKNPAPVDMVNIGKYPIIYNLVTRFYKILYIPGGDRRISEPSTVSNIYQHYSISAISTRFLLGSMALACADGNSVEYDIGTLKSVAKRVLIAGIVSTSGTRNHVFSKKI